MKDQDWEPNRHRPPNRRPAVTEKVQWNGQAFFVSAGYSPESLRVVEVFYASGLKEGTDLRAVAHDACVLVSLLLQVGMTPAQIGHSLASTEVPMMDGETVNVPASLIGAIVETVGQMALITRMEKGN